MEATEVRNDAANTKVNTNQHLSFKACFPDGWREYFRKEEVLRKVLEAAGLGESHDFVKVNSHYLIDDHRIAIILLMRRKDTEVLDKVIVDVTTSHPRFEQLIDVLYNVGSDCDHHIILYDNNGNCDDLEGPCITRYDRLTSLMDYLDGCAFVAVMGIDLEKSGSNDVSFQCVDIEMNTNRYDGNNKCLPDRRDLEEANFWGPYFIPAHRCYGIAYEYNFGNDGYEEDGCDFISSSASWGDGGMKVTYYFEEDDFKRIITNKISEMEKIFEGCSISHDTEESSITIRRSIPFRNFICSVHRDRENLAEEFAGYATLPLFLGELFAEGEEDKTTETSASTTANTSLH